VGLSWVCLAALPAASCRKRSNQASEATAIVATVGDREISAAALTAKLAEQPPIIRSRYSSLEKKKEFLDSLVRLELLASEAYRRGLDKDPEVRAMLEKLMVQKLIRSESESGAEIPDNELKTTFEAERAVTSKPERVRVSHIFLAGAPNTPQRGKAKSEAERIVASLKAPKPATTSLFERIVAERSDDQPTRSLGGDLGFRTREELVQAWGESVARGATALAEMGSLSAVVEGDKGVHILKLLGRQAASSETFETAKPRIVARLTAERRAKAVDRLIDTLKGQTAVKVNEAALEAVRVESLSFEKGKR
jgi:parvulin-like peptidyl-prolyl isomerase